MGARLWQCDWCQDSLCIGGTRLWHSACTGVWRNMAREEDFGYWRRGKPSCGRGVKRGCSPQLW